MHKCVITIGGIFLAQSQLVAQIGTQDFRLHGLIRATATGNAVVYNSQTGVSESFGDSRTIDSYSFTDGPYGFTMNASADTDGGLATNGTMVLPEYLESIGVDPTYIESLMYAGGSYSYVYSEFVPDSNFGGHRFSIYAGSSRRNFSDTVYVPSEDPEDQNQYPVDIEGVFSSSYFIDYTFDIDALVIAVQRLRFDPIVHTSPFSPGFGSALIPWNGSGSASSLDPTIYDSPDDLYSATGVLLGEHTFQSIKQAYSSGDSVYLYAPGEYRVLTGNGISSGEIDLIFVPCPAASVLFLCVGTAGLRRRR